MDQADMLYVVYFCVAIVAVMIALVVVVLGSVSIYAFVTGALAAKPPVPESERDDG